MSDSVPVAEAMEQAQAALDAEAPMQWDDSEPPVLGAIPTTVEFAVVPPAESEPATDAPAEGPCWCGITHAAGVTHPKPEEPAPVEAAAPTQAELFPPPPPPPFDFEKAYEDLARADQRARLKKSVWESCKRGTKDAREEYDEALEALHTLFQRIDTERRIAERAQQFKQPVLRPVADAAPQTETTEGETTEGGEEQTMSDLEQTIDDPQEPEEEDAPDDDESEEEETTTDAPGE
jgi:hypothetical protein